MNATTIPAIAFVGWIMLALQFAWYVAVTVLIVKIWRKVKHLPG